MTKSKRKLTRNGLVAVGLALGLLWLGSISVPTVQNTEETDIFADSSGVVEDIAESEDASQVEITNEKRLLTPVTTQNRASGGQQNLQIQSVMVLKDGAVVQVFDEKQAYNGETVTVKTKNTGKYTVKYNIENGWTESFAFVRTQGDVENYRPLPVFR